MQTCSLCIHQNVDTATECKFCDADLSQHSTASRARVTLQENPRVSRIRLIVADDACPACRELEGDYAKNDLPDLPTRGCSNPHTCRCFYEPMLVEVYP